MTRGNKMFDSGIKAIKPKKKEKRNEIVCNRRCIG